MRITHFIISALSLLGLVWIIEQTGARASNNTVGVVIIAALIIAYITKPVAKDSKNEKK